MAETRTTKPAGDLLTQLVQANYNAYASTTKTLIDSLIGQVADLNAKLAAIRDGVTLAFDGPYMPTPARVTALLWPSDEVVDRYREGGDR
jgi:hypothetical protein